MDFLSEVQSRVLPADGAPGPLLRARGFAHGGSVEELCASQPDAVRQVHADFIGAGSRLIRTNSFAGNAVQLAEHACAHRVGELNWLASQLAVSAAKGTGVHVAACLGPLGGGPTDAAARRALFEEQLGALLDGGARLVLLEGFSDLDELVTAIEAKHTLHHCPVIATVVCDAAGEMPDGTAVATAFARLRAAEADVVGVSCERPVTATLFNYDVDVPLAVFHGSSSSPEEFSEACRALTAAGAALVGGGRGVTPEHLAAFAEALTLPPK